MRMDSGLAGCIRRKYNRRTFTQNWLTPSVWAIARVKFRACSCKLLGFRRIPQRRGRRGSTADDLLHSIEISCAGKALVFYRFVSVLAFTTELLLLQTRIRSHAADLVGTGQFEHGQIQRMETCQSDKLELVSHGGKFTLKLGNSCIVQMLPPIE